MRLDAMKVSSSIYKGIQYVQVSTLPSEQRDRLLVTIDAELFIKILVDGKLLGNCLQFKDYESWFENVYKPISVSEGRSSVVNSESKLVELTSGSSSI
jgi:hypothetical protein